MTVKLNVPPPELATTTVDAAGFAPPCCAAKLSVVGLTDSTGGGAFTDTLAVADFVGPAALVAFTVTV